MWDIQNIVVPDMEITHWGVASNDLFLSLNSRLGVSIFRATQAEINTWKKLQHQSLQKAICQFRFLRD